MPQKILKPEGRVVIFADSRERYSGLIGKLEAHGALVNVKNLDVADYLCSDRVAIERKTSDDFIQSVIDRRLFSQLNDLSCQFERPVLLIEGDVHSVGRLHPNALRGVLASIVCDYKVPMLCTRNADETAAQIFWLAKREQASEKREVQIRGKKRRASLSDEQEYLVAGLPKVSCVLAKRLLSHFKTPENVFAAPESELQGVDGVGGKLAKKIRDMVTGEYKGKK